MDEKAIYNYCRNLGCCVACCLRYLGIKNSNAYANPTNFALKFQAEETLNKASEDAEKCTGKIIEGLSDAVNESQSEEIKIPDDISIENTQENNLNSSNTINELSNGLEVFGNGCSPPSKKLKLATCISCLGVLQEFTWQESINMVKEVLDKKGYACNTFACALSAPIATMLRERVITLQLTDEFPGYDHNSLTPLKEAWKWSFGTHLSRHIHKTLDSGAISPLLVTLNIDYDDDIQELEILKKVSPQLFEERSRQRRRFATEFTRRSVEQALETATLPSFRAAGDALSRVSSNAHCVSVICTHAPIYVCGRYVKLSRNLPQSPWVLDGKRVLPSSVQEIIFGPIAKFYNFSDVDCEGRLKFIAAGREDVDVRCLGDGRPFAIEITDPKRELTSEELNEACDMISTSEEVVVKKLVPINREDLALLKKGEETKSKTYEALCIKLTHSKHDDCPPDSPITVTPTDLQLINDYKESDDVTMTISQKTPLRVLHRRPLLVRKREILEMSAVPVPEHPQLFRLFVRTSAGTYVKEWVHGELGRSTPSLGDVMGSRVDLLALDVTAVHLQWPPVKE
nr:putative tRNA pseudouridine synthase Pus10 isoform X1 [Danaus plexippus plexippus]